MNFRNVSWPSKWISDVISAKKEICVNEEQYIYSGEIDQSGHACGQGTAIKIDDPEDKYIGTFLNDLPHGFCKSYTSLISCRHTHWGQLGYVRGRIQARQEPRQNDSVLQVSENKPLPVKFRDGDIIN